MRDGRCIHRAALPLGLLFPGRRLAAGRAGAAGWELGYEALALTDHNSVSGSMELAQAAAAYGIRALHGAELDVAVEGGGSVDGPHSTGVMACTPLVSIASTPPAGLRAIAPTT